MIWGRSSAERPQRRQSKTSTIESLGRKVLRLSSTDADSRRREFVLTVMILGLIAAAMIAYLVTLINSIFLPTYQGSPPWVMLICVVTFISFYWLRYYHLEFTSYLLVFLLLACGLIPLWLWGVALPQGLLICALAITVAGILLDARWAIGITAITGLFMALMASLQSQGVIASRTEWHHVNPDATDALVFSITFAAIAMVSWLSHRQTMRSLHQAKISEAALTLERNSLERRVEERSRELEQVQLEQILQLQRFAEFGRVSSGLVHDIMNPLTAVTLNLDQASDSEEVRQAKTSLSYIERYVEAVGKQLRESSIQRRFVVAEEIESVLQILEYRRRQKGVVIDTEVGSQTVINGDPVTFSQVVANLVANAIDAYDESPEEVPMRVVIRVIEDDKRMIMTVQDWGMGIPAGRLKHIFEPFYTTKQETRGIGIGLAMARTVVERDFRGSLSVASAPELGTRFTVEVPLQRKGVVGERD